MGWLAGWVHGLYGVDKTDRIHLHLVHVDSVPANGHNHLLAVTSGVGAVGRGQTASVWPVLLQQRGVAEVGSATSGGENNGTV